MLTTTYDMSQIYEFFFLLFPDLRVITDLSQNSDVAERTATGRRQDVALAKADIHEKTTRAGIMTSAVFKTKVIVTFFS